VRSFNCYNAYNKVDQESRIDSVAKVQTVRSILKRMGIKVLAVIHDTPLSRMKSAKNGHPGQRGATVVVCQGQAAQAECCTNIHP